MGNKMSICIETGQCQIETINYMIDEREENNEFKDLKKFKFLSKDSLLGGRQNTKVFLSKVDKL